MTKARTRTARFPQHIREDAFACYCPWLQSLLALRSLTFAPSPATVKRWMERGHWTAQEATK